MNTTSLWTALRAKLGITGDHMSRGRTIALQHLVLSEREIDAVQQALDRVGEQLAVRFELQEHAGDIVLLDAQRAAQIAPQVVEAFTDGRPVVTLAHMQHDDEHLVPAAQRLVAREAELLRQLREIPIVRQHAGRQRRARPALVSGDSMQSEHSQSITQTDHSTNYDTSFDSRLDADQLEAVELDNAQLVLLRAVLHGMRTPRSEPMYASYADNAHLRFDFAAQRVHLDALAEQYLRVQRELPKAMPSARPQAHASVRDMVEVVWEMGLACGLCHPIGAPAKWWHEPLTLADHARIDSYTRNPRHLAMALHLATGPATPSALRSRARVSVAEVRRFIQACLMAGQVHWGATPANKELTR
jgi:hypothetical protein